MNKDLNYYKTCDKVVWVPVHDIKCSNGNIIKADTPTPCIYVEDKDNKYYILQLDLSIKDDQFRYTAWRKVIGITYNIRVEVLLINNNQLFKLDGSEVLFNDLGRSTVNVNKEYLGKCDVK
jgi:hypothetical protein